MDRLLLTLTLVPFTLAACGDDPSCPAGSRAEGGRCVMTDADAGAGDDGGDVDASTDDGGSPDGCDPLPFYPDGDGDGYGDGEPMMACTAPEGYAEEDGDCDDGDPDIHPGATEACNGRDDDCDGTLDQGLDAATFYADMDDDGHGDEEATVEACAAPPMYVDTDGDCDDDDETRHPGATEVCDGVDQDCDGVVDENLGGVLGPPIVLRERGALEDAVSLITLGAEYVVGFAGADGKAMYQRLNADGSSAAAAARIEPSASDDQDAVLLVDVDGSRFVAIWREASTLRARLIRPADGTVTSPVTITSSVSNFSNPAAAAVVDDLVVVAWRDNAGQLAGRSYELDLTGASSPRTLLSAGVTSGSGFGLGAVDDASPYLILAYRGQTGSDSSDRAYVTRLSLRPLTVQSPVALSPSGTPVAGVGVADAVVAGVPTVGVVVAYGSASGLELRVLEPGAFGSPLAVARTVSLADGGLGFMLHPALSFAHGRADAAVSGAPGGTTVVARWAAADEDGGDAASFGTSHFIGGLDVARLSTTEAAVVFASTPVASPPPADLLFQRIGCP